MAAICRAIVRRPLRNIPLNEGSSFNHRIASVRSAARSTCRLAVGNPLDDPLSIRLEVDAGVSLLDGEDCMLACHSYAVEHAEGRIDLQCQVAGGQGLFY